jgi:hypothetical protein
MAGEPATRYGTDSCGYSETNHESRGGDRQRCNEECAGNRAYEHATDNPKETESMGDGIGNPSSLLRGSHARLDR